MIKNVLFLQGAGQGAYEEDAQLATSLRAALGPADEIHYPRMPEEDSAAYADCKARIAAALAGLAGEVSLVGHSVGGSVLLSYLSKERVGQPVAGLFVIDAPYWGADEFWSWDEARLGGMPRRSWRASRRWSSTTAATTRSCPSRTWRCTRENPGGHGQGV
jgi:predicted alpha/beta hydrolase family esterase